MRKILLLIACFAVIALSACEDEIVNPVSFNNIRVSAYFKKSVLESEEPSSSIDSLVFTNVKILLNPIRFHNKDYPSDSGLVSLSGSPFVYNAERGDYNALATDKFPIAVYDTVLLGIYRFNESEASQYASNEKFSVFTDTNRYSIVIQGAKYKNGVKTDFTYCTNLSGNLRLNIADTDTLISQQLSIIYVVFDPSAAFVNNNYLLDPSEATNRAAIDNAMFSAFSAKLSLK